MPKAIRRRLLIVGVFALAGLIGFLGLKDPAIWIYAGCCAAATVLFESLLFSKRGIFLYSLIGLIAGFYSGKLLYELFSKIAPTIFIGTIEPYVILTMTYLGFSLPFMASQKNTSALSFLFGSDNEKKNNDLKLLDTSVIIDGRIADIAETGFISGTLLLPKFVLNEIQALADSKDPIKRSRARRGLDVLNKLKEIHTVDMKIFTRDFSDIKGVDAKLISLAKELSANIITNDYNLNKVAKLDGIQILNLNDLANALKPVLLPGEEFELDIIKEGKESNQGVGYLSDGTMVVVANGLHLIGRSSAVRVTSILQTSAGRIVFTEPKK